MGHGIQDFLTRINWSSDGSKLLFLQKFKKRGIQPDRQEATRKMNPMEWHTYCFTYHRKSKQQRVYVDAVEILEDTLKVNDKDFDLSDGFLNNLKFMLNGRDCKSVDKMTDINIWNVTLDHREIKRWTACKSILPEYKVVNWKTADWNVNDIVEIGFENSSAICKTKNEVQIYQFNFPKTFLGTADFCHLLGGNITIARNNATAMTMINKCTSFAGFNDLDVEGQFINPYTRNSPKNISWAYGEPNNFGIGEDCTKFVQWGTDDGLLNDISCDERLCSLCDLNRFPQFELRGFCNAEILDVKYQIAIEPSFNGTYPIAGWRRTDILWNSNNGRWEIIEYRNDSVIAICNSTTDYPFGVQRFFSKF